jgi:hypothetical protein
VFALLALSDQKLPRLILFPDYRRDHMDVCFIDASRIDYQLISFGIRHLS